MSAVFRVVGPGDEAILSDVFADIDGTYFRPHPFTPTEAGKIARQSGRDVYAVLIDDGRAVAYGMLRGWSEGYAVPSLGIAVRSSAQGRGYGRTMMDCLRAEAGRQGASAVRLRVHPENVRARRLYEALGYEYAGEDRGELVMFLDISQGPGPSTTVSRPASPLTARLLDVDAPEWETVLREARHDFYHLPGYAAMTAVQEGGRPGALHVTDGSRTLLLPLLIRRIPGGGLDATSPYGYPGPIGSGIDDPAFMDQALASGLQVLRGAGVVSLFVRLHPLLNPMPPDGIGETVPHGDTVSVDLTLPPAAQWAQTRPNHRRDILRATRLGYTARMDEDWTHFETFKRLYRGTMERRSALPFYFFSDSYFDGMREAVGSRLHLCVVENAGTVAAAGLFVETDGIVQYHLSGTDSAASGVQPTKLMIHFVRTWARERGNVVLHLGGGVGGSADSLLQFKAGFSTLRHTFTTLRVVVDEQEYGRLVAARHPHLDPRTRSGFFPAYREA